MEYQFKKIFVGSAALENLYKDLLTKCHRKEPSGPSLFIFSTPWDTMKAPKDLRKKKCYY